MVPLWLEVIIMEIESKVEHKVSNLILVMLDSAHMLKKRFIQDVKFD